MPVKTIRDLRQSVAILLDDPGLGPSTVHELDFGIDLTIAMLPIVWGMLSKAPIREPESDHTHRRKLRSWPLRYTSVWSIDAGGYLADWAPGSKRGGLYQTVLVIGGKAPSTVRQTGMNYSACFPDPGASAYLYGASAELGGQSDH